MRTEIFYSRVEVATHLFEQSGLVTTSGQGHSTTSTIKGYTEDFISFLFKENGGFSISTISTSFSNWCGALSSAAISAQPSLDLEKQQEVTAFKLSNKTTQHGPKSWLHSLF